MTYGDRPQGVHAAVDDGLAQAVLDLHRPIDGWLSCPHEEDGESCGHVDGDRWVVDPVCGGGRFVQTLGQPRGEGHTHGITVVRVCAHCVVGSYGSDPPDGVDPATLGNVDGPPSPDGYVDTTRHRIWPCPTAVLAGASA